MIDIRTLPPDHRGEGHVVAARAFTNEPFMVELAGDDPTDRLAVAVDYWRSQDWSDDVQLGAFVGDVLVGVCLCSLQGRCLICTRTDLEGAEPGDDEQMDRVFARNVRAVHAQHGDHARLTLVAVDPVVQHAGIGHALVTGGLTRLRAAGVSTVLLECEPKLEPLYGRSGFAVVGTFWDPSSNSDAMVMRASTGALGD
jgi:ribosomal protein S18 acetylase RimI-like enzyme